jgi:hypothetical protein
VRCATLARWLGTALCVTVWTAAGADDVVGTDGSITLPEDFRATMTHLGSWFVPEGAASGFHDVYVSPGAAEVYRREGRFPDGAVLVKELRAADGADYTTGAGVQYASAQLKQWFVMVKDRAGRFSDNPLWGDGWGWALFKPDAPAVNVATNYRNDCLGCHEPARQTDLIYVEAYPKLRR